MHERVLAAIPVGSFVNAKSRLGSALTPPERSRLTMALAARTALTARDAGADVSVIGGDHGVVEWAQRLGFAAALEPDTPGGLNGAAAFVAATAASTGRRTFVLHADLPCVTAPDLRRCFDTPGVVIAPSHDGGTAVLGGVQPEYRFAYGAGSFHRHLASAPDATVITRPGLALDLDHPADLQRALSTSTGHWLRRYVGS